MPEPEPQPDPRTIFREASRRVDPAERSSYLDAACLGDASLRRVLDALLAEPPWGGPTTSLQPGSGPGPDPDPGPDDATRTTAPGTEEATRTFHGRVAPSWDRTTREGPPDPEVISADAPRDGALGQVIADRYRLVAVLGEGGMGTVYRAEQDRPIRREVALKLIKAGTDSRAVIARFEAERQALALMEHPNIARVFDGGATASGRPYFVMEYVRGEPITRYCDRHRLPVRARLELLVAACRAVQHAHQKGIIHRDLKPGNVLVTLVDGRPTPKVIDFGVARATEFNVAEPDPDDGAIVGTPTYMSPEQADPATTDIDTRTDVYALGVILFELLVGSPPIDPRRFRRGATVEMLRMVRELETPRPSTRLGAAADLPTIAANRGAEPAQLARSLRGELDWVVMKALEKDRARRYGTADGLARDLQRFLADEVVEARPPSARYRARKFVRRHRPQVVAAGLVLLAMVAGIVGTTLGLLRAEQLRGIAEREAIELGVANAEVAAQKARAEENFATARALILDLGTRINQIETGQADPRLADRARQQALDLARRRFEPFRAARPDDETVQMQAAALHRYAANVSRLLMDFPAAESAYAAAIATLEGLTARVPGKSVYRNEMALALSDRAMLEKRMGKLAQAGATLDRAWGLLEGAAITAGETPHRRALTLGLIDLDRAEVAYRRGRFDDFARFAAEAVRRLDALKADRGAERLTVEPLFAAIAAKRHAMALRELGRTAEALAAHDDAVARAEGLGGPQAGRDVLFERNESRRERACTAALVPERRAAAVEDLADVTREAEKLVADHPQIAFYREGLAADYLCRGELLILLGKPEEATADLTRSLAASRELLDRHGRLSDSLLVRARAYLALGRARAAAGKADEAAGHWKNAITIFEMALKADADNVHHQRGLAEARAAAGPPV